jgi:hypothetical protein
MRWRDAREPTPLEQEAQRRLAQSRSKMPFRSPAKNGQPSVPTVRAWVISQPSTFSRSGFLTVYFLLQCGLEVT